MRRREFLAAFGGAAAASPFAARAQQARRMRRIGVLVALFADDALAQARNAAFLQGLGDLGWRVGRNLQIDFRWGAGDTAHYPKYAAELVELAPDVILAVGASVVWPLLHATRTVPVVFVQGTDPIGAGYVASLARPGGNATEFTKQIVSSMTRAAVLLDPMIPAGLGRLGAIQSLASSLRVELTPISSRDAPEMERAVGAFARGSSDGLIVLPSAPTVRYREQIIATAAQHRLPAMYPYRYFVTASGLISYGLDEIEQYRQAAGYIDRILKGGKPADLRVQTPVRYELVIDLKTARALGLTVPDKLLARADEVIE
jgi:putative tryptophan/tyrosine transport system substrate-binding protein